MKRKERGKVGDRGTGEVGDRGTVKEDRETMGGTVREGEQKKEDR